MRASSPPPCNITCYRGRTPHSATLPWVTKLAYGPKRFFYYSLFESDQTGAPFAVRNRAAGSTDAYAAAVGRWLVTRDGFDFLAYYLSDFDYASHAHGPEGAEDVGSPEPTTRSEALVSAAGGADAFLERYAVIVLSDDGQTPVERAAQLELPLSAFGGRHRRDRLEPRRAGVSAPRCARRRRWACKGARRGGIRRGVTPARGRRRGRTSCRRGAALPSACRGLGDERRHRDPRPSRRIAPLVVGARESERGRAARLRGRRLGVCGPGRPSPRGRRQSRVP